MSPRIVDRREKTLLIVRKATEVFAEKGYNIATMSEIAERADVLRFRVEYPVANGQGWTRRWSKKNVLPAAIRVNLTLADPDRPDRQVSRKAVFPLCVN